MRPSSAASAGATQTCSPLCRARLLRSFLSRIHHGSTSPKRQYSSLSSRPLVTASHIAIRSHASLTYHFNGHRPQHRKFVRRIGAGSPSVFSFTGGTHSRAFPARRLFTRRLSTTAASAARVADGTAGDSGADLTGSVPTVDHAPLTSPSSFKPPLSQSSPKAQHSENPLGGAVSNEEHLSRSQASGVLDEFSSMSELTPPDFSQLKRQCSRCDRIFVSEESLNEHTVAHDLIKAFKCSICDDRTFETRQQLIRHEQYHEKKEPAAKCPTCGDNVANMGLLARHLSSLPQNHESAKTLRSRDLDPEDLYTEKVFFGHRYIVGQAMHHATFLGSKQTIQDANYLKGDTECPFAYVGALSEPGAPPCAYFDITPSHEVSIPSCTMFPRACDPGELCSKLIIDLDHFYRSPLNYKLFFCGFTRPQNSQSFRATSRALVLFAEESSWEVAKKYGQEIDMATNSILRRDSDTGRWTVSTSTAYERDSGQGGHKLVIAVLNGVDVTPENSAWWDVAKAYFIYDNIVRCPFCARRLPSFNLLNEHIVSAHEGKGFKCFVCRQTMSTRRALKDHVNSIHFSAYRYKCDQCSKEFQKRGDLQFHKEKSHTGREFRCTVCDRVYQTMRALKRHHKMNHKDYRVKCDSCTSSFRSKESLQVHKKLMH